MFEGPDECAGGGLDIDMTVSVQRALTCASYLTNVYSELETQTTRRRECNVFFLAGNYLSINAEYTSDITRPWPAPVPPSTGPPSGRPGPGRLWTLQSALGHQSGALQWPERQREFRFPGGTRVSAGYAGAWVYAMGNGIYLYGGFGGIRFSTMVCLGRLYAS